VVLLVLLMSGLQIFNAHPALYLGSKSDFENPILAMQPMMRGNKIYGVTTVLGWRFDTTGVFGLSGDAETGYEDRGFPWWATLPGYRDLAMDRRWHFFFAWLFLLKGREAQRAARVSTAKTGSTLYCCSIAPMISARRQRRKASTTNQSGSLTRFMPRPFSPTR